MPSMRLVNPLVRSPEVPAPPSDNPDEGGRPPARTLEKPLVVALGAAVLVVSVVLRFWTPSPMWLDEALTVNIAREPLRAIPHLLRRRPGATALLRAAPFLDEGVRHG